MRAPNGFAEDYSEDIVSGPHGSSSWYTTECIGTHMLSLLMMSLEVNIGFQVNIRLGDTILQYQFVDIAE